MKTNKKHFSGLFFIISIGFSLACIALLTITTEKLLLNSINQPKQENYLTTKNRQYNPHEQTNVKIPFAIGVDQTDNKPETDQTSLDSIVFNLTLAVNSINNVLTGASCAFGILTLFVGIIGLIGFSSINKRIKEVEELTNNMQRSQDNFLQQVDLLKQSMISHDLYSSQTIGYLHKTSEMMANQIADNSLKEKIINNLHHDLHVANLYHSCISIDDNESDDLFADFVYFEKKGTVDDICHLQIVASHSKDNIKERALEIIGRIKERENVCDISSSEVPVVNLKKENKQHSGTWSRIKQWLNDHFRC